jgi:hypothetical protein
MRVSFSREILSLLAAIGITAVCSNAATLPTYTCKMTKETMTIDGVLNEKTWGQADTLKFLENVTGGALVAPRQSAYALAAWDSTNLYVSYVTKDNDIKGVYKNHDDNLYDVEAVELFFDADGDGTTYIELEWNCYNASWDGLTGNPAGQNWTATGMTSAVKLRGTPDTSTNVDTGMTVEVKIPWRALDTNMTRKVSLPPKNNDQMRINFYRIDQRTGVASQDLSAWSPTLTTTFHTPAKFGNIIFSTTVPTVTGKSGYSKTTKSHSLKASDTGHGAVRIAYNLDRQYDARLCIRAASGETIKTIENRRQTAGNHETIWNGTDSRGGSAADGVYFVSLNAGPLVEQCKINLIR